MAGESSTEKRKRSESLDEEAEERPHQRQRDLSEHHEETLLPQRTDEDRISDDKDALRDHIDVGEESSRRAAVLFFVEIGPGSAGCRHVTCKDRIKEDSYRIAVLPGMYNYYQSAGQSL